MSEKRKTCLICGKPLKRGKYYCSYACCGKSKQSYFECVVCGAKFQKSPSAETVTCSEECSVINRQRNSDRIVSQVEKAHEVMATLPHTSRTSEHMNAKWWVIESPPGRIFKVRNLLNWLREHEDMLDGTVEQAWNGISKIKYSAQGKRKYNSYQWKGWLLHGWPDDDAMQRNG